MDITPQDKTQQPISDDQELAKALAGVVPGVEEPAAAAAPAPAADAPAPAAAAPTIDFEETPAPAPAVSEASVPAGFPPLPDLSANVGPTGNSELDGIKKDALEELRPLIDKVDLPAEEKFTIYLMLIRSTDDSTLIAPAHEAALKIEDEEARAKALLDIIKEIDYFAQEAQKNA